MSLEEFENKPDRKTKRYLAMRSITDIGMGLAYIVIGLIILFARQLKFENEYLTTVPVKIFAVVVLIYGSWRIYRGVKKDYLKNNE